MELATFTVAPDERIPPGHARPRSRWGRVGALPTKANPQWRALLKVILLILKDIVGLVVSLPSVRRALSSLPLNPVLPIWNRDVTARSY